MTHHASPGQALAWEFEDPAGVGSVHHLTVLCYYLQHPSLLSPRALTEARSLLDEFVERGTSPREVRLRNRGPLDSGRRAWRLTGPPASYERLPSWTMTVAEVVHGGRDGWCDRVRDWARSVHVALKAR